MDGAHKEMESSTHVKEAGERLRSRKGKINTSLCARILPEKKTMVMSGNRLLEFLPTRDR
jgi:hypothetical protein